MSTKTDKRKKPDNKNVSAEINIVPLLMHLLKKLPFIIIVGVICAVLSFLSVKFFLHPTYRCGFTAYVNNQQATAAKEGLSVSDVNASKQLVLTYSKIIKSNTILSAAKDTLDLNYSVKQLKKMVGTQIEDDTEIIQIYVIGKSPEEAYKIANAISSVSPKQMADIVEGSSMKIVDYPQVPDSIYSPSYFRYTLLGFIAGVVLSIIVFVIQYLRNDTISSENEIESRFSVPVLGVIPDSNNSMGGKSGYYYDYYYKEKDSDKDKGEQNSEKA